MCLRFFGFDGSGKAEEGKQERKKHKKKANGSTKKEQQKERAGSWKGDAGVQGLGSSHSVGLGCAFLLSFLSAGSHLNDSSGWGRVPWCSVRRLLTTSFSDASLEKSTPDTRLLLAGDWGRESMKDSQSSQYTRPKHGHMGVEQNSNSIPFNSSVLLAGHPAKLIVAISPHATLQ